jgi:hypothetical protein
MDRVIGLGHDGHQAATRRPSPITKVVLLKGRDSGADTRLIQQISLRVKSLALDLTNIGDHRN